MLSDFIAKYFMNPMAADSGYNIVNTLVFGIILIMALVPLAKLLERLKIKLDLKFYIAMLPLLFLGSSVRVLVDFKFYQRLFVYFTPNFFIDFAISPGIYVLIFAPALLAILIAYAIREQYKIPEHKTIAAVSTLSFFLVHALLYTTHQPAAISFNPFSTLLIVSFAALTISLYYSGITYFKIDFLKQKIPFILVSTHLYDASTTFVWLQFYGFWEKHVLPSLVMGIFGPFSMFILKLLVVPAVVYLLRDLENKTERNLIYFAIFVLGFAPGTRNLLLALLGT